MKKILITGAGGFIGFHLTKKLLEKYYIVGIDNLNEYYDVNLKKERLKLLKHKNFKFIKCDISNKEKLDKIFKENKFDIVINLAAQVGVRYSLEKPETYIESNIIGFYNILECCKNNKIKNLIFASSSSVYGDINNTPYSENSDTNHPESLYAVTKKTNELLAYTYSKLYNINCVGLRFFTVYGPYGRPDMAYYSFTNKLLDNGKIKVFNNGQCKRDFTYIDDVVNAIEKIIENKLPKYNIYNIGNSKPILLKDFINVLTNELIDQELLVKKFDIKKHIELLPIQKGDVKETHSNMNKFEKDYKFKPKTTIEEGIKEFVKWYKEYNKNIF